MLPSLKERVYVRPRRANFVQDGAAKYGKFLAVDGRQVVVDSFWFGRIRDGEVMHWPVPADAGPEWKPGA